MKRFYIVRIDGDVKDTYASPYCVGDAIAMAQADAGATIEYAVVYAADAGAARLKTPTKWHALPEGYQS